MPQYDARTDALLALLKASNAPTPHEFAILALACADQAGLGAAAQRTLAEAMGVSDPRG